VERGESFANLLNAQRIVDTLLVGVLQIILEGMKNFVAARTPIDDVRFGDRYAGLVPDPAEELADELTGALP
jgi:hypothetical protein